MPSTKHGKIAPDNLLFFLLNKKAGAPQSISTRVQYQTSQENTLSPMVPGWQYGIHKRIDRVCRRMINDSEGEGRLSYS